MRGSARRLRVQILRAAVDDNLDAIHGRLPKAVRPWRNRVRRHSQMALSAAVPLTALFLLTTATRGPAAAPAKQGPSLTRSVDVHADSPVPPPERRQDEEVRNALPIDAGALALATRRVIVDAGHGGSNAGTSGRGGLMEKEVTLDIAERVRQLISSRGFEAVMTRATDETLSLRERAMTANDHHGDVFVSIHINSLTPATGCGIETYYPGPSSDRTVDPLAAAENQQSGYSLADLRSLLERVYVDVRRAESKRLATSVQHALLAALRQTDPALTDRGVKTAPFVVLLATDMPAILAEVSCLSSRDEVERLRTPEYRQAIAGAVAAGVQAFARE